ncbi:Uncharacterized protein SHERM_14814 [Striga hermonthica]|uniref:Uncharacterized protein n=1 Tax=Striga hermonthica TaxID=68872 RepID=A0A9N7MN47_STRHE|nr:Uncharacterized protein SHERM_14814 [Striga hermonthica]
MGSCLSKKSVDCANLKKSEPQLEKKEKVVENEIFIIKHRDSNEIDRRPRQQGSPAGEENGENEKSDAEKSTVVISNEVPDGNVAVVAVAAAAPVRTSSCTMAEVDAILIQCGRLSRSSSTAKAAAFPQEDGGGRKYSGSKRSHDFDGEGGAVAPDGGDAAAGEREDRWSERRRHSQGWRRTPSRERDSDRDQKQLSGSRERGGGRRVSRSPGRRSESPSASATNLNSNSHSSAASSRPRKMVSVPATVSSAAINKSQNAAGVEACAATGVADKRIQVKRNVSPRARSPARTRVQNTNSGTNQQIISLSRSISRKAKHSPCRRNPLAEIDTNIIQQAPVQKPKTDSKTVQPLARSRSSRLSRDLDAINPETLILPTNPKNNNNNTSTYTALLLEDIQNFHQKNNHSPEPAFSLPPCVAKACSILEAVADLNSSTGSNLSSNAPFPDQTHNFKKMRPAKAKDPSLESEVSAKDDLMEPSFHKYVTVRRGTSDVVGGEEESFGSSSFHKYVKLSFQSL